MKDSEGGIELINVSRETILTLVERISREYTKASHTELISLCAILNANLGIYQLLTGIDKQVEALRELYKDELE